MSETRRALEGLRQEIETNPSHEGRATTFVDKIARLLKEAVLTNDIGLVRAYAEELSRSSVQFGQSIANPQMRTETVIGAGR